MVQGMRLLVQSIRGMAILLSCTRKTFFSAAASYSPSEAACGATSTCSYQQEQQEQQQDQSMVQEEVSLLQVHAGDQDVELEAEGEELEEETQHEEAEGEEYEEEGEQHAEAEGEEYQEEKQHAEAGGESEEEGSSNHAECPKSGARFIGDTTFDKQITAIYGLGNSNDSWTASRGFYKSHISKPKQYQKYAPRYESYVSKPKHCAEVALRAKVKFPNPSPNGVYGPFDTDCHDGDSVARACWNFDFSINSDCEAAASPTHPVGGLTVTYELCVDNDPTDAVHSICFDPLRSFRFDNVFGNVTTGPGEGVTATSYLQYVDLMQSQTITQNSQNPAFVGVWTTLFPSTVNGIFSLSLTAFAQHQHKHRQNHKNRRNRQWQHDKHRTALAQDQDRPSHHHKQHKQHKQRKQHQRKSSGCQVAIARTTITVLQQVHTSTTHVIR
ncbi:unnamed protein product [Polarella glacialis]|uniref:Uncharacterized protein n=2 Tax=Polarella glacialis TaxID=89957 RepID=A0A813EBB0_POLGL|nr:unnamed protein product [Polarella glacialis]